MKKQLTTLLVRPAARGGKYLGPDAANANHQSAFVFLLNPVTEALVAYGVADASNPLSAGPLDLMSPVSRSAPFATDDNTVQVQLSVEISEPTDLRVLVYGPLSHPDQAQIAQADITVLPGVNIGTSPQFPEGLVIEVPGLCISNVTADWQGSKVSCFAKVTMMCGCPIRNGAVNPGWFWPDSDFSVQLVTYMKSKAVHYYRLAFDNTPGLVSSFSGQWPTQASQSDSVEQAWLYVSEPKLGNQGKYRISPAFTQSPLRLPQDVQKVILELRDK
ncbi:MAG: hypothetical protein ACXV8P_07800 [Methylobacter sp.]